MSERIRDRLRGARRLGIYAGVATICALLLIALGCMPASVPATAEKTALEARLEAVLSRIEGVGDATVMITQDDSGNVIGAVVVAGGMSDVRACLSVQSAIRTLLGIDLERIRIISGLSEGRAG